MGIEQYPINNFREILKSLKVRQIWLKLDQMKKDYKIPSKT